MTATAKVRFDADTASLSNKLDKLNRQHNNMNEMIVKGVGSTLKMVSAVALLQGAWAAVKEGVDSTIQRIDEAADRIQGGARARARALSLAQTPQQREQISQAIEATRVQTGMDEARSSELQYQLMSLRLADMREEIARLENLGQDSVAFARGLSRVSRVMGIQGPELYVIADKLFTASLASESGVDQLAEALAQAAPLAKETGSTVDELAALFGGVGGDELAQIRTGFRGLSRALVRQGITEGGILSGVDQIAGRNLSPAQLQRLLGDEAFVAFQLIQAQRGSIASAQSAIAQSRGSIANAQNIVLGDPQVGLTLALAREQAKLDIRNETGSGFGELIQRRRTIQTRLAGHDFLMDLPTATSKNLAELLTIIQNGGRDDAAGIQANSGQFSGFFPGFLGGVSNRQQAIRSAEAVNVRMIEDTSRGPATYRAGSQEGN